jgi:hypothetical protein
MEITENNFDSHSRKSQHLLFQCEVKKILFLS